MMNCTAYDYELTDQAGHRYRLDGHCLEHLSECMDFMRLVVEGDLTTHRTCQRRNWSGKELLTELGRHQEWMHGYFRLFSRERTFHPYVKLFLRVYREHAIRHQEGIALNNISMTGRIVRAVFENFVRTLRGDAKRFRIRKLAADWQGKYDRNADRLIDLMGKVGDRSKLFTVVELELDYSKSRVTREEAEQIRDSAGEVMEAEADAYWSGWSLDRIETPRVKVLFEEVQRDRKHFFANLKGKPTLFRNLLAYVWRIRFTPVAGYGLQISLIIDGAEGEHADLRQEIGRYWADIITQGRGCFRELESWPAIDAARQIAALGGNAKAERTKLRRKLMAHLGGPLSAVQVLPYRGCNLVGTGLVHRRSVAKHGCAASSAQLTRGGSGCAHIQDPHFLGATATYLPMEIGGPMVVSAPVPARKRATAASKAMSRSAR